MPTFLNPVGSSGTFFPPQLSPLINVPASGNTIAMPMGTPVYVINKTTLTAALTVRLPPGPYQGQRVQIIPGGAITTLNVQTSGGAAITGSPFAGVANTTITFMYRGTAWGLVT